MKILFFSLIVIVQLHACDSCITEKSHRGKHITTRVVHSVKKTENGCTCKCTGKRSDKNECQECWHKIAAHK